MGSNVWVKIKKNARSFLSFHLGGVLSPEHFVENEIGVWVLNFHQGCVFPGAGGGLVAAKQNLPDAPGVG